MTPAKLITVYGLFTPQGFCLYVGATQNPQQRESQLRAGKHPKGIKGWRWTFKPLAQCSPTKATRLELETIIHYRAKGQAVLNRYFVGRPARKSNTGFAVRCKALNLTFLTMQAAADYFGCSTGAVSRAIWKYGGMLSYGIAEEPVALEMIPELSWHPKQPLSPAMKRGA